MTNEDVPSIGANQVWLEVLLALLVLEAITAIKQQGRIIFLSSSTHNFAGWRLVPCRQAFWSFRKGGACHGEAAKLCWPPDRSQNHKTKRQVQTSVNKSFDSRQIIVHVLL
jgi:hypothetical protein